MGLISEFKEFALKGSVVDLAVGVVIGAAFGSIVNSLVKDVMMPPLGLLMGGVDFSDKKIVLRNAVYDAKDIAHVTPITPEVDLAYGRFINNVIQFLIIAIAIFIVIKLMNSAKRKPAPTPDVPPAPTREEVLLAEIRDAIRAK